MQHVLFITNYYVIITMGTIITLELADCLE